MSSVPSNDARDREPSEPHGKQTKCSGQRCMRVRSHIPKAVFKAQFQQHVFRLYSVKPCGVRRSKGANTSHLFSQSVTRAVGRYAVAVIFHVHACASVISYVCRQQSRVLESSHRDTVRAYGRVYTESERTGPDERVSLSDLTRTCFQFFTARNSVRRICRVYVCVLRS